MRTLESLDERFAELQDIADRIADVRAKLSGLPTGIPETDTERLSAVTEAMRHRLRETKFGSYDVAQVGLDPDSLRPSRSGFDVDTDVSASDVVRIKVAYLDSIRIKGQSAGHHPGMLMLDEPRQQDIELSDYGAMLRYLANDTDNSGQTIITSATPRRDLDQLIAGISVNIVEIGSSRLLQPESVDDELDRD